MRSAIQPNFLPRDKLDMNRISAFRAAMYERKAAAMKTRAWSQKPMTPGQLVRMQLREKPYTWSEMGHVTGVTDHGESYLIGPLDGSQVKLRNRRFVKPKEPEL